MCVLVEYPCTQLLYTRMVQSHSSSHGKDLLEAPLCHKDSDKKCLLALFGRFELCLSGIRELASHNSHITYLISDLEWGTLLSTTISCLITQYRWNQLKHKLSTIIHRPDSTILNPFISIICILHCWLVNGVKPSKGLTLTPIPVSCVCSVQIFIDFQQVS